MTTKQCPKCSSKYLILLSSHNLKICSECNTYIPWFLEENQKPLI